MRKIYGKRYACMQRVLAPLRLEGQRIVMCSGTFDLMHIGHIQLLQSAKLLGDVLVVAVKSDKAASLKKVDPPVLNQDERMETVASLAEVDYVVMADYDEHRIVPFNFGTKCAQQWVNMFDSVIKTIRPDIFVHEDNPVLTEARDYVFGKYGVESVIQPRMEGISTTEIIHRVEARLLKKMGM